MFYAFEGRIPRLVGGGQFVADSAQVIGAVTLQANSSIWFGCVLRGDCDDIVVGEGSNVQDGSILHTDHGIKLVVGRHCTIGHQVMLHGCQIGEGSLIGIQSVVLNGARLGRHTLLGAGSLVTEGKQFPDGVLLMGRPAKIVRELTADEIGLLHSMSLHYVDNAQRFRRSLHPCVPESLPGTG
jgi:carbonic anhydrase/acetyltransferase-like protein (isoleucine patch superfamily)